ncbi:DUF2946 family protein [Sphingomonas sp. RT2P30]
MRGMRHLFRRHARLAWLMVTLALAMKVLVPAGFMPVFGAKGVAIVICSGSGPMTATMAMPGMATPGGDHDAPGKHEAPCAFAGLAAPGLGGADIIQLAIALAAIVAFGVLFTPIARRPIWAFLRPPLRGPPALR